MEVLRSNRENPCEKTRLGKEKTHSGSSFITVDRGLAYIPPFETTPLKRVPIKDGQPTESRPQRRTRSPLLPAVSSYQLGFCPVPGHPGLSLSLGASYSGLPWSRGPCEVDSPQVRPAGLS